MLSNESVLEKFSLTNKRMVRDDRVMSKDPIEWTQHSRSMFKSKGRIVFYLSTQF